MKNSLPDFLVRRLRDYTSFQSARYKIAVAAVMARAGYEIIFLDDRVQDAKHCEFIASHVPTGIKVGVEAKSRVRQGTFHRGRAFIYTPDKRGIEQLLRKARKQKPKGLAFFIFIDMNLPPLPNTHIKEKAWFKEFKRATDSIPEPTGDNPDAFNAIFATNFAHHYGTVDGEAFPSELAYVIPTHTETPLTNRTPIEAVVQSLQECDKIPFEI